MQRKAGQSTFGSRFGGRTPSPEMKLGYFRRHLRQPKVPSRSESLNFRGQGSGAKRPSRAESHQPSAACSAAEPSLQRRKSHLSGARLGGQNSLLKGFGGRTLLRRPNLSSSRTQLQAQTSHSNLPTPKTCKPQFHNLHILKYRHKGVQN